MMKRATTSARLASIAVTAALAAPALASVETFSIDVRIAIPIESFRD
jgi:hypothetical protein